MSVESVRQELEEGWMRDQRRLRRIDRATLIIPALTIGFLFYLLIWTSNWSSSLIALSLFGVFTRLSVMVAFYAYLYPAFLGELRSEDPVRQAAAVSLLESQRRAVLFEIRKERFEPTSDEAIDALSVDEIRSWDEVANIPQRRRLLTIWRGVWAGMVLVVAFVMVRSFGA